MNEKKRKRGMGKEGGRKRRKRKLDRDNKRKERERVVRNKEGRLRER